MNPEKFTNISAQDFLKASYNISPRNIDKRNVGISKFFKPTRHKKIQETDEALDLDLISALDCSNSN